MVGGGSTKYVQTLISGSFRELRVEIEPELGNNCFLCLDPLSEAAGEDAISPARVGARGPEARGAAGGGGGG